LIESSVILKLFLNLEPATMKAVVVKDGKAVVVYDRPKPQLQDGFVLIEVAAVALNPTDWKHLEFGLVEDGCLVGCDFAGTVVEVGKGVNKELSPGDRVAAVAHGGNSVQPEDGAFAEYVVAKGDILIKLPDTLTFEKAATLPLGVGTVMQGLYQKGLKLKLPDEPTTEKPYVLIYGGATATGALGIQYARLYVLFLHSLPVIYTGDLLAATQVRVFRSHHVLTTKF
jgi:NADPH:quinone reductase-like Zn-dependent oxidoreductase